MRIVSTAFAAFAAVSLSLVQGSPASAADFGGDCCADLEERIAELEATTARKGTRKVSLFVYGEISQAVMFWDDGAGSDVYQLTNSTTKTKFGFEGQAAINSDWSAGFRIELDVVISPSDFADQGSATFIDPYAAFPFVSVANGVGDDSGNFLQIRHANWFITSRTLGRITVGQGSQATDGIAEIDLSGSTSVALSSVETWNETFFLRDENGFSPQVVGRTTIGALSNGFATPAFFADLFIGNLDGGRGNFVRYDSPTFAGFTLSAAWGEDDDWDVALRYAGEYGGFQFAAGLGYREGVTIDTENIVAITGVELEQKTIVGSASLLHTPTGLFVSLAGGRVEYEPYAGLPGLGGFFGGGSVKLEDAKYFYGKAGIYQKFFPIGKTSIYGEYYTAWDVGPDAAASPGLIFFRPTDEFLEQSHVAGFGVVQHIDAAAMELYAAYRRYWADDVTDYWLEADTDIKMDTVMAGARIKF